ncbi:membrane protease subunit, partial [Streptomyces sp. SID7909]|nr:membrane protease subunit [Streptomyces sp. SID7909]
SASVSVPAETGAHAEEPEDAAPEDARPAEASAPEPVKDAAPEDAAPEDAAPEDAVPLVEAPRPEPVLALAGGRVPGPDVAPRPDPVRDSGRHQAVIANERTASIPVHLL